jgi:hypothetical protein
LQINGLARSLRLSSCASDPTFARCWMPSIKARQPLSEGTRKPKAADEALSISAIKQFGRQLGNFTSGAEKLVSNHYRKRTQRNGTLCNDDGGE